VQKEKGTLKSKDLKLVEEFTENTQESRQILENGLRILAKMIASAILKEKEKAIKMEYNEINHNKEILSYINTATQQNEKLAFTVTEAAKLIGLSRNSTYDAVRRGQIPSIRMGKRILIPKIALERILRETTIYEMDSR